MLEGPASLPIPSNHVCTGSDGICSHEHIHAFTSAISEFRSLQMVKHRNCLCEHSPWEAGSQAANLQWASAVQPCNKTTPQHPIMTPIWPRVVGATSMYVTHHIPSLLARNICWPQVPAWVFLLGVEFSDSLGGVTVKDGNSLLCNFVCSESA